MAGQMVAQMEHQRVVLTAHPSADLRAVKRAAQKDVQWVDWRAVEREVMSVDPMDASSAATRVFEKADLWVA